MDGARFTPYECVLRRGPPRLIGGASCGLGGAALLGLALRAHGPVTIAGRELTPAQVSRGYLVAGLLFIACALASVLIARARARRTRRLRIDRDELVLRDDRTGATDVVRYHDVSDVRRTIRDQVRRLRVIHGAGELTLEGPMFPSNDVFDQVARLVVERVGAARAA